MGSDPIGLGVESAPATNYSADSSEYAIMEKKTALITGCSSGFGKLAAKTFNKNGWNVIATMRSPENETELTELDPVLVTRLDVTDPKSVRQAVEAGLSRFGAIHVLVNNAGFGGHALFEQFPDEVVRAMYDTNVFGLMNVTREVLPLMRRQNGGCIINVTSVAGLVGGPTYSVYASTKFAVEGLTEAIALEYGPLNILAKTVAPGAYETRFSVNASEQHLDQGGEELAAYARRLREHMQAVLRNLRPTGGPPADPQEVADKIYECATSETPIHNPVGSDAEMIVGMMSAGPRQAFLDQLEQILNLPPQ